MRKQLVKCSAVAKHICDNLDTDLNSARCREIRRHIEGCPNCYAYLDSVKKTVRLYRVARAPKVPARARKKLLAVLHLK